MLHFVISLSTEDRWGGLRASTQSVSDPYSFNLRLKPFGRVAGCRSFMTGAPISKAPAMVQLSVARNQLAIVWLGASAVLFLLLIGQTILGHFENRAQDVWSWALPTIMPTLTLVITVMGANALRMEGSNEVVNRWFLRLAVLLSIFYLLLVLFTLLIEPMTSYQILDLLKLSQLWLGPLQGLVAFRRSDLCSFPNVLHEPCCHEFQHPERRSVKDLDFLPRDGEAGVGWDLPRRHDGQGGISRLTSAPRVIQALSADDYWGKSPHN